MSAHDHAERALRDPLGAIVFLANTAAGFVGAHERFCILDGTQYAPSWRAIRGAYELYEHPDNADGSLSEAVDELLNALERDWSGEHGESLGWEDGCLYVYGPDWSDHD